MTFVISFIIYFSFVFNFRFIELHSPHHIIHVAYSSIFWPQHSKLFKMALLNIIKDNIFRTITVILSIWDLVTDWQVMFQFSSVSGDRTLTIAIRVFCGIATILFLVEVSFIIASFYLSWRKQKNKQYRSCTKSNDIEMSAESNQVLSMSKDKEDEKDEKMDRKWEIISFLILLFEDLPVTVILYFTLKKSSCSLFLEIYEKSIRTRLSLISALVSATWKLIKSAILFCCCCCKCRGIKGWRDHIIHCFIRTVLQPTLAVSLIVLASYILYGFENSNSYRSECYDNASTINIFNTANPLGSSIIK